MGQQEGCSHNKIKSRNSWVGDSQTGEHLYHRSPPTRVKVLSPTLGFPTWGSGKGGGIPRESDFESQHDLIAGLSQNWGNRDSTLGGHTQSNVHIGTQGKEQSPHRRLNQTYLLVLEGLLQRQVVAVAHCGDKDTGSRSSGKCSLA